MPSPAYIVHLAKRFFGSLDPRPPSNADRQWVRGLLTDGEFSIWSQMSNADQRHSIEVARAVVTIVESLDRSDTVGGADLVERGDIWPSAVDDGYQSARQRQSVMTAAALMHDSGKNVASLPTLARVGATLLQPIVAGAHRERWIEVGGVRQRVARYWEHPEIGGAALVAVGSDPLVSSWAREHHRPHSEWTVPHHVGHILRQCDND